MLPNEEPEEIPETDVPDRPIEVPRRRRTLAGLDTDISEGTDTVGGSADGPTSGEEEAEDCCRESLNEIRELKETIEELEETIKELEEQVEETKESITTITQKMDNVSIEAECNGDGTITITLNWGVAEGS